MIGSREIERGVVGIKVQKEDSKQFEVSRADLVEELKKLLIF